MIEDAFRHTVVKMDRADSLPKDGAFLVLGNRGEDIPWISAARFQKVKCRDGAKSNSTPDHER
jgi:hypothetical protein